MILNVQHICKSYGGNDILKDVSFHVEEHDRIAVNGINGAGKTTLLRLIAGEETPDRGSIAMEKDLETGYLPQNPLSFSDKSIYEEMIGVRDDLLRTEARLRDLEQQMKTAGSSLLKTLYERYEQLNQHYERSNGYALESRVTGILKGLGFSEAEFDKPVPVLSGGYKTRLELGKLLLREPRLLMLDEPTNHLDIASLTWLEGYLKNWTNALLLVSHDRYFLDRIATKVLDLDNGHARMYTGGYSAFSEKKAQIRKDMMKAWLNNQAAIRHQQEVIAKLKQFNREKSIKRAESREKLLEKTERLEKPFDVDDAMRLHFTPSCVSGTEVLCAEDLSKSYGSEHLFSHVKLELRRGEKLAIIGPNGTGKTTLLKIIEGSEQPDTGFVEYGAKVRTAYYDQEHHNLDPDSTVFEEISDAYPRMTETEIRNLLASFLFTGDDVFKQIRMLSGGERGRVSLAKLMLSKANLLLLDEPTNHLDVTSREILEEAIRNYEGSVVYVSHDRYFINHTCTSILELENGRFVLYRGNYDYYLEKKADPFFDPDKAVSGSPGSMSGGSHGTGPGAGKGVPSAAASSSARDVQDKQPPGNKEDYARQKERKARLQKLKSRISACEAEIHGKEEAVSEIDEALRRPDIASDHVELEKLSSRRTGLEKELEALYREWESLSEQYEAEKEQGNEG